MEIVIIDYLRSSTNYNESMTCNVLNNSTFTCKNNNWMYYSNTAIGLLMTTIGR